MSNNLSNDDNEPTGLLKSIMLGICGFAVVFAILTLMPMFFTLLSDGDFRAPSEIHPTDTLARQLQQQSPNYQQASPKSEPWTPVKRFSTKVPD